MRISDWSSDVCSSDLLAPLGQAFKHLMPLLRRHDDPVADLLDGALAADAPAGAVVELAHADAGGARPAGDRSEERRVGKECVSVDLGGRRTIKKKKQARHTINIELRSTINHTA